MSQEISMRIRRTLGACAILPLLAGTVGADSDTDHGWRDDFTARLEATALLQTLNAELLSHDSATLTLDRWCESHHLASPPRIVAEQVRGAEKAPTSELRRELSVDDREPIRYRRVRLRCGDYTLSEADNWYVPSRLTSEMNQALETTNIAFGRAVQALRFQRHTLSAKLLWSPLPDGWESGAALPSGSSGTLQVPAQLIEHRAILLLPDGTPFSEVAMSWHFPSLRGAERFDGAVCLGWECLGHRGVGDGGAGAEALMDEAGGSDGPLHPR